MNRIGFCQLWTDNENKSFGSHTVVSKNEAAIHLLENNLDKIDWMFLSENPGAIHLLEANLDKIYWQWLSINPTIFELDYVGARNVYLKYARLKEASI